MSESADKKWEVKNRLSCATVEALSIDIENARVSNISCTVVTEDTLTLEVEGLGSYTLLWTPTAAVSEGLAYTREDGVLGGEDDSELLALALGFLFSEGLIETLSEVVSLVICPNRQDLVEVQLEILGELLLQRRNVTITSSCGMCGARDIIDNNPLQLTVLKKELEIAPQTIIDCMEEMTAAQQIFQLTGGSHAAAEISLDGKLISVCEDLGRHNALDKVIGKNILLKRNLNNSCVLLSSRLSLEMVLKAIKAGVQVIAAVGAPTSLALEVAEAFGLTLCGFVRGQRLTVFTHPERISHCNSNGIIDRDSDLNIQS